MELDEPILADDYPIYGGYLYVADNEVVVSDWHGTVKDFKQSIGATEIRRCDMFGRSQLSVNGEKE